MLLVIISKMHGVRAKFGPGVILSFYYRTKLPPQKEAPMFKVYRGPEIRKPRPNEIPRAQSIIGSHPTPVHITPRLINAIHNLSIPTYNVVMVPHKVDCYHDLTDD